MITKEHLAVSGCFPRAFHSFQSMFFQNISMALVKYPDVFEKSCTKAFRAVSFFFFFRRKVCLFPREKPLLFAGISVRCCRLLAKKVVRRVLFFDRIVFLSCRRRILSLRLVSWLGSFALTCLCKRYGRGMADDALFLQRLVHFSCNTDWLCKNVWICADRISDCYGI